MKTTLEKETYKMSQEEREIITKELDDAIKYNENNPQNKIWNSTEYREKYAL